MPERTNFDHYLSQHYLKLFTNNNGQLFVGDVNSKLVETPSDTSRVFGTPNWSVAQEFEDIFTSVETTVAGPLRTVSRDPSAISSLAVPTQQALQAFILLQHSRSPAIHDALLQQNTKMETILKDMAPTQEIADGFRIPLTDRPASLELGLKIGSDFDGALSMKGCLALLAPDRHNFIVGDNPLVTLSSAPDGMHTRAIFLPTSYFWFPLTSKVGLFFADALSEPLGTKALKKTYIDAAFCNELNKSEVLVAKNHIAGSNRNLVRLKLRAENVGELRNDVRRFGFSPLVINHNRAIYQLPVHFVTELRAKHPGLGALERSKEH